MKPNPSLLRVAGLILLLGCLAGSASAQPAYVNYQGKLTDAAGQPLATGTYTLEFNIYNDATGADPTNRVWGPMIFDGAAAAGHGPSVSVIDGRFNVILGPDDASARSIRDAFAGENRFLEIKVNGGAPILPRQQFLSSPYAFRAGGTLGDLTVTGTIKSVVDSTEFFMVPRGAIIMWSGAQAPPGWALCDGQNGTPDLQNKFVRGAPALGPYVVAGSDSHTHTSPTHFHSVDPPNTTTSGNSGSGFTAGNAFVTTTASPHGHTHTVNIVAFNSASTSVTTDAGSNVPLHYTLAFIMKL